MSDVKGPYHDVRALKRGLQILEVLGKVGWAKPSVLSTLACLDRSSTYRLLSTLQEAGYVVRREDDGSFTLTARVKALSDGYTDADKLSQIAAVHLQRLTAQISWPCDFAILAGGEGMIVESTHRVSPMSIHRAMIGQRRSLITSALGKAMLCALMEDEREFALNLVSQLGGPDAVAARDRNFIRRIFEEFQINGYTSANGIVDSKIASIALPIRVSCSVVGAINIIFFRSALTISQAAELYLQMLRQCAQNIQQDVASEGAEPNTGPATALDLAPSLPTTRNMTSGEFGKRPRQRSGQADKTNLRSAVLANKAAP